MLRLSVSVTIILSKTKDTDFRCLKQKLCSSITDTKVSKNFFHGLLIEGVELAIFRVERN
jgi:hypothetical protein